MPSSRGFSGTRDQTQVFNIAGRFFTVCPSYPRKLPQETSGYSEGQGKPGMLQSMGSQRVGHDLATEQEHNLRSAIPPLSI